MIIILLLRMGPAPKLPQFCGASDHLLGSWWPLLGAGSSPWDDVGQCQAGQPNCLSHVGAHFSSSGKAASELNPTSCPEDPQTQSVHHPPAHLAWCLCWSCCPVFWMPIDTPLGSTPDQPGDPLSFPPRFVSCDSNE